MWFERYKHWISSSTITPQKHLSVTCTTHLNSMHQTMENYFWERFLKRDINWTRS